MKPQKPRHRWSWLYEQKREDAEYSLWRQVLAWVLAIAVMGIAGAFLISLVLDAVK